MAVDYVNNVFNMLFDSLTKFTFLVVGYNGLRKFDLKSLIF